MKKIEVKGELFHVSDKFYFIHDGVSIYCVNSETHNKNSFSYKKESAVKVGFQLGESLFFRDNASLFENGDLLKLDMQSWQLEHLGSCPFSSIILQERQNDDLFFILNMTSFSKSPVYDCLNFETLADIGYEYQPLVHEDGAAFIPLDDDKYIYSTDFELKENWRYPIKSFCNGKFNPLGKINHINNQLLFNTEAAEIVSIDIETGERLWCVEEFSVTGWCHNNDGKLFTCYKGNLKKIDVKTGQLEMDIAVNEPLVQSNSDELHLFQVNISKTHLWCGFLGHGVCAINLETAEIDWHGFDGQSLNSEPKILNNQMFLQFMSGGIGLDNTGMTDYILEGEGGYLEGTENTLII